VQKIVNKWDRVVLLKIKRSQPRFTRQLLQGVRDPM